MDQTWELKAKIEALLVASDRAVTIEALAQCLEVSEDEADEALREFEADLMAADRGIQLRRRPHGVRIETKPQYTGLDRAPAARKKRKTDYIAGARNACDRRAEAAGHDRRHQRHPRHRELGHHPDAAKPETDRSLGAPRAEAGEDLADYAAVSGDVRSGIAR